jgi:hypothetical protein
MKKLMTFVTVLVLLASFAVGAYGAVDLAKKPDDTGPDTSICYYACIDYGTFMSMYYCCPTQGTVFCEFLYSAVAHCG